MNCLALILPALLVGCAAPNAGDTALTQETPPPAPRAPTIGEGACDAAPAQSLVGSRWDKELSAKALRLTGAQRIRVLGPGSVVTMDYRTDRLNIDLDDDGVVTGFRCG